MRFSNGSWLNKDGIMSFSPQEVYSIKEKNGALELYVPCKKINQRGDTLEGPVLTYTISVPMKDVFKISMVHYKGIKDVGPHYEILKDDKMPLTYEKQDGVLMIKNGEMSIVISEENGFHMDFYRGKKKLTTSGFRSAAYITPVAGEFLNDDLSKCYMREQLGLSVGELVYGLGERFTPFIKNGQTVETWNEDGGTSTAQSYKTVPFYITNRDYGVFVNHPEKVSFEVGSEKVTKVQFSVPGEKLEYFIIGGESMKEVLENYTNLTGKPALPPAWSFGLWLTTSFTTNYDEATVMSFVDGMAKRDIPLQVFHFDCFWMKGFNWCDFTWDEEVFPDPVGMLKRMHDKGLKICVWINPYISEASSLFDEAAEKGYLVKRQDGSVWQWDMWQPGMAYVDFTNPGACNWFASKLEALLDMGVDCFKTDFGERIPTENVVYYDGSDTVKMHNYYTFLYNKVVFDLLKHKKGEKEAVLFARSATAGGQQFPVHWGGDCTADFESMAESLRGGLSLCLSGFGYWSHDMGGFESTATADVYKRWAAFGLLSSHSRLHGSTSYRVPWLYDEESVDVVRYFTKLKCSLMPYLFKQASNTAQTGVSTMRAMVVEFEKDPACAYLDKQYMLGDNMLVAPIFNEEGIAQYYVPEGKWTKFLTGEVVEGGKWYTEKHDYLSVPLLVRENSIIPIGKVNTLTEYDYRDGVILAVYELKEGQVATTEIINMNEEKELMAGVVKIADKVVISIEGNDKPWTMILKNVDKVKEVQGGSFEIKEDGAHITPDEGCKNLTCYLY
ncbi:alpha-xylosidase [Cellulosilyticum ruminicola]